MTLILSNEDVEQVLTMAELIPVLADAFVELGEGRGGDRVRTDIVTPTTFRDDGLYALKSMDGVIPKLGVGATRINSDILTFPTTGTGMRRIKVAAAPGNRYVGLVLLFSTHNGEPLAIFPDGVVQSMRVGGTSAIAADCLARKDSDTVAILGSGWQARTQLTGLDVVRDLKDIRVYSPAKKNREIFAAQMSEEIGKEVRPVESAKDACKGAHIIHCSTNTSAPVFLRDWLEPGMHIGTIRPGATELEKVAWPQVDVMTLLNYNDHARLIYTHDVRIGEETGGGSYSMARDEFHASLATVPDIMAGKREGRTNDGQISSFFNNGMGYQFAAAGYLINKKARELGIGHQLPTDWFTQTVHP